MLELLIPFLLFFQLCNFQDSMVSGVFYLTVPPGAGTFAQYQGVARRWLRHSMVPCVCVGARQSLDGTITVLQSLSCIWWKVTLFSRIRAACSRRLGTGYFTARKSAILCCSHRGWYITYLHHVAPLRCVLGFDFFPQPALSFCGAGQ